MDLSTFEITDERGFLPEADPPPSLPRVFAPWEATLARLSSLVTARRLRSEVEAWPLLEPNGLEAPAQLNRAMLALSLIGNAYVWGHSKPASRLPEPLARPWSQIAERLGRPPILSHASLVLQNWFRLEPEGPLELDNLATRATILGGMDERWFYLVTVAIEAAGAPIPRQLLRLAEQCQTDRRETVSEVGSLLDDLAPRIFGLTPLLERMRERCDPYVFYHRVRPYLAGWAEPGLVYEGVSEEPRRFAGGSAAQSSLLQAIDAGLGLSHPHPDSGPFLRQMRTYMPPPHRSFIERLEQSSRLRSFVDAHRETHSQLVASYDRCVEAVERFRVAHRNIVTDYVSRQANVRGGMALGTGGTAYGQFLGRTIEETKQGRLT